MTFGYRQANALLFSCVILVSGLMALDFINPSLPYIMKSFGVSEYATKQLIVFFFAGVCLSQFCYGAISDNYGRKITIVAALSLACIGILISIYATSIDVMYIGRFINGFGSGGAPVIARAIIADAFKNQKSLNKAFSYYSIASQISPAIAPVIGGAIQQYYNWRLVYFALLVINILAVALILINFTETRVIPKVKLSYLQQFKIYREIFKVGKFILFSFASAFLLFINIAYYSYLPFVLHKLHYLPLSNALIYCIYATSLVTGSYLLLKKCKKVQTDKLYTYCLGSCMLALLAFMKLFSTFGDNLYLIIAISVTIAFINGILTPLTNALCISFAQHNKGATSAVQSFIRLTFTGVCLYLFNFILIKNMNSILTCILVAILFVSCCFILGGATLNHKKSS